MKIWKIGYVAFVLVYAFVNCRYVLADYLKSSKHYTK